MLVELVTFETKDAVALDGAWYAPSGPSPSRPPVLIIHGLGWNFYLGPSRWLPPLLAAAGYPCLALNMRDHDDKEVRDFDRSADDIATGIAFLEQQAARPGSGEDVRGIALIAHGYGCNKLLSYARLSGDNRPFRRVLTTLGAVKSYNPALWDTVLAAASVITGNMLIVQGAEDRLIEASARAEELHQAAVVANVETVLLEGGDHYFNAQHEALANCILDWFDRTDPAVRSHTAAGD